MPSPSRFALAACLLVVLPGSAHARHVTVDTGTCRAVDGILTAMHAGASHDRVKASLDSLLDTPAYRTMFHHYNRSWRPNHLPPAVFERMILSLEFPDEYHAGENPRADSMLVRWRAAYDDLPRYESRLRSLEAANLPVLIDRGVAYAQTWLPKGWTIPDFTLVVQPQGGSPAFSIDDAQGYDFLQLPSEASGGLDVDWLVGTIAHESNHLGIRGHGVRLANPADSIAYALVNLCVAEGVANEFISGPPAGLCPKIPGVLFHVFTPPLAASWEARVAEEPEIFAHMAGLLDRAVRDSLTQADLDQEMRSYWFEGVIGRGYVFGSEMLGAIDLGLGKAAVLEAIEDPRKMFALYDRALDRKPRLLAKCVRLPRKTIEQALAIGKVK